MDERVYKIELSELVYEMHCDYYAAQYAKVYEDDETKEKRKFKVMGLFLNFMTKWLPVMYAEKMTLPEGMPGLETMRQIVDDMELNLESDFQLMMQERFPQFVIKREESTFDYEG